MERQDRNSVLRAKYRDYCSAQMADAILSLSPGEIYSLAVAEARAVGQMVPDTYNDAIRLATGRIRERLGLPEFDEWALEYRENPEEFDPYMIGFWKSKESDPP